MKSKARSAHALLPSAISIGQYWPRQGGTVAVHLVTERHVAHVFDKYTSSWFTGCICEISQEITGTRSMNLVRILPEQIPGRLRIWPTMDGDAADPAPLRCACSTPSGR